jgi:uncharacterized protein (DUF433 family)
VPNGQEGCKPEGRNMTEFLPCRKPDPREAVHGILEICHGKPCMRGLRYPVETILEYLAGGDTVEDLLAEFPDLEREDILACLEFSRRMLAARSVYLALK